MTSRTAGIAALLGSLALGSLLAAASAAPAQNIPVPAPAPQPKSYAPPTPRSGARTAAAGAPARTVGRRIAVDFQAAGAVRRTARHHHRARRAPARAGRPGQRLSQQHPPAAWQFRPGRPRRRQVGGRVLPAEARQDPLRLQSAEPDRTDRRRLLGGGARPQARHPGPLPAVADAAALPAVRPHRSGARHQSDRRLCRRRVRHHGDRGEPECSAARIA